MITLIIIAFITIPLYGMISFIIGYHLGKKKGNKNVWTSEYLHKVPLSDFVKENMVDSNITFKNCEETQVVSVPPGSGSLSDILDDYSAYFDHADAMYKSKPRTNISDSPQ